MLSLFSRDGHQVHVVLPDEGPLVDLLEAHGIVVHVFRSLAVIERGGLDSVWGKFGFCFRYPYSICWLSTLIVRLKVDVVHTNTAVLPAPALAAWLTGRKHIWHIREFFVEFPAIWRFYQKYVWLLSNAIITVSNAVRDQFDPRFRQKCATIYDGLGQEAMAVDLNTAQNFRSNLGDPEFLVGVVGRIKWVRKGQEVLIKAAGILSDRYPQARYAVVGSVSPGNEDHLGRLRKLIRDNNLEEKVIFTGDLEETRDIYAAFDVTVVPSVLPEPFGRVVTESMAAGTPVIGSRCGGIPEQIVDGLTGLLFSPGDEEDLARALTQLMGDKAARLRMGKEGQRHVREQFDERVEYVKSAEIFGTALHPSNVALTQ
jgi:glycosyltransferase involved in cell wall biosynthesis